MELKFRLVLRQPPIGVDFGLQLGKSATCTIVQVCRSAGEELVFEFVLKPVVVEGSDVVDFRGPAVQGPKDTRFVYICSGQNAGSPHSPWSRRLKVPLTGITSTMVRLALQDPAGTFETIVPGTARDGGPNAATVKPFGGWTLAGSSGLSRLSGTRPASK